MNRNLQPVVRQTLDKLTALRKANQVDAYRAQLTFLIGLYVAAVDNGTKSTRYLNLIPKLAELPLEKLFDFQRDIATNFPRNTTPLTPNSRGSDSRYLGLGYRHS